MPLPLFGKRLNIFFTYSSSCKSSSFCAKGGFINPIVGLCDFKLSITFSSKQSPWYIFAFPSPLKIIFPAAKVNISGKSSAPTILFFMMNSFSFAVETLDICDCIAATRNPPVPQHVSTTTSFSVSSLSWVNRLVIWCGVKTIPNDCLSPPLYFKNSLKNFPITSKSL